MNYKELFSGVLKMNNHIQKKDYFSISYTITRVLNTGIVMSIEKNEKELRGLKRQLEKLSNRKYCILFNSNNASLHGALWGLGYVYGDKINLLNLSRDEYRFIKWLGLDNDVRNSPVSLKRVRINWNNINDIESLLEDKKSNKVIQIDFSDLSFGPCAAILTNDEIIFKKAERLIIFGAFDLKTMWTQQESENDIEPALQLNYRLSPLVGACVKLAILRRNK